MHIRLARIDAPEMKTGNLGTAARDFLTSLCPPQTAVLLHSLKDQADKYGGRWDGEVFTGTWDGDTFLNPQNVSDLMVRAGHAVPKVF